jgi:hypothetical protein
MDGIFDMVGLDKLFIDLVAGVYQRKRTHIRRALIVVEGVFCETAVSPTFPKRFWPCCRTAAVWFAPTCRRPRP